MPPPPLRQTGTRAITAAAAITAVLLLLAHSAPASAQLAASPAAQAQPMPYSDAVAARFPVPAGVDNAPVLAPGASGFTSNAELSAQLAAVVASAPAGSQIRRLVPGQSQGGLDLQALHFSRGPGRPLVLLIGQQHGDEPAGAEALLVLARLLANGRLAPLLDQIDVTLLPRANPDGADWQRRVSQDGTDINRDHLLLRTPEARAVAALVRQQRPLVVLDLHEHTVVGRYLGKFNAVQRNDLLLQYAMVGNLPARLGQASETWFRQPIVAALAAQGLTSEWYYTNPIPAGDKRLVMGGVQPDTSRNVMGLRHAISLLLETRGVGLHRLHLARRMHSHVVAVSSALQQAASQAAALQALQASTDAEVSAQACQGRVVVEAAATPTRRTLLMLDPDSGADKPVAVDWLSALDLAVLTERARPCGYWLDANQPASAQVVAHLQALGLHLQRLPAEQVLQTEAWQETARVETARPDVLGMVADAERQMLRLLVDLLPGPLLAPAGSWYLPLDQPLANLAVAALEPDSQSSFVANRLIARLADVRRVLVRPAGLP